MNRWRWCVVYTSMFTPHSLYECQPTKDCLLPVLSTVTKCNLSVTSLSCTKTSMHCWNVKLLTCSQQSLVVSAAVALQTVQTYLNEDQLLGQHTHINSVQSVARYTAPEYIYYLIVTPVSEFAGREMPNHADWAWQGNSANKTLRV